MFKIRNKVGNFFALCVAIAFGLVLYAENKSNAQAGYTAQNRADMTMLVIEHTDFNDIPRLSVEDLGDL